MEVSVRFLTLRGRWQRRSLPHATQQFPPSDQVGNPREAADGGGQSATMGKPLRRGGPVWVVETSDPLRRLTAAPPPDGEESEKRSARIEWATILVTTNPATSYPRQGLRKNPNTRNRGFRRSGGGASSGRFGRSAAEGASRTSDRPHRRDPGSQAAPSRPSCARAPSPTSGGGGEKVFSRGFQAPRKQRRRGADGAPSPLFGFVS